MKKMVIFIATPLLVLVMATQTFASSPRIMVNNKELPVSGVKSEQRVLVPLRAIFEALNATVDYDPATKTITGNHNKKTIILKVNDQVAKVNGKKIMLDVPAKTMNGSTLVPVRFIAESLGATVEWHNNTVLINSDMPLKDENEAGIIVLEGVISHMSYKEVLKVQGISDPNLGYSNPNEAFTIFTLSKPQNITLRSTGGDTYTNTAKIISLRNFYEIKKYDGKTITISIDLNKTLWPSDTSLPLGQPTSDKYKIIE